jgi:hypothetical protein
LRCGGDGVAEHRLGIVAARYLLGDTAADTERSRDPIA